MSNTQCTHKHSDTCDDTVAQCLLQTCWFAQAVPQGQFVPCVLVFPSSASTVRVVFFRWHGLVLLLSHGGEYFCGPMRRLTACALLCASSTRSSRVLYLDGAVLEESCSFISNGEASAWSSEVLRSCCDLCSSLGLLPLQYHALWCWCWHYSAWISYGTGSAFSATLQKHLCLMLKMQGYVVV